MFSMHSSLSSFGVGLSELHWEYFVGHQKHALEFPDDISCACNDALPCSDLCDGLHKALLTWIAALAYRGKIEDHDRG